MATSFSNQIDVIVSLMTKLAPRRILDIGKGFGKYGFLLHEYYGIDNNIKPDATKTLALGSRAIIDAVECNQDYLWPHISQFCNEIFVGRIEDMYLKLKGYDAVLMADVIEHLEPRYGKAIIEHFISAGSTMVVSTPNTFFNQEFYDSSDEHHVSFWGPREIPALGFPFDYQTVGLGRVFLISSSKLDIRALGIPTLSVSGGSPDLLSMNFTNNSTLAVSVALIRGDTESFERAWSANHRDEVLSAS